MGAEVQEPRIFEMDDGKAGPCMSSCTKMQNVLQHTAGRSDKIAGVDFIKVWRTAQIIEIALSKLGTRRKACSTLLKSFSIVGRRAKNSLWNRPLEHQTLMAFFLWWPPHWCPMVHITMGVYHRKKAIGSLIASSDLNCTCIWLLYLCNKGHPMPPNKKSELLLHKSVPLQKSDFRFQNITIVT